jgi:hypothetical protein
MSNEWCKKCGCGNKARGYACMPDCEIAVLKSANNKLREALKHIAVSEYLGFNAEDCNGDTHSIYSLSGAECVEIANAALAQEECVEDEKAQEMVDAFKPFSQLTNAVMPKKLTEEQEIESFLEDVATSNYIDTRKTVSKYNGVCVGGKYDGELKAWDRPAFTIAERPILPPVLSVVQHKMIIDSTYNFHSLAETGKGLWVHSSITLNIALLALIDRYAQEKMIWNI